MTDVRVVTEFPRRPSVREQVWIPLADGTRLAARVWRPDDADADPVPAVLEYLPYRLNDGTAVGDHQQMTVVRAAMATPGARVDIRGTGESDGSLRGRVHARRSRRTAWRSSPGSRRSPGAPVRSAMMGYSWSGFNSLQLAARRPPALKAMVTAYASDDRYADRHPLPRRLVLPMHMVHWADLTMLAFDAVPPDPAVVGDGWREQWLERLDRTPPFIERWLAHQRRDEYWQPGLGARRPRGDRLSRDGRRAAGPTATAMRRCACWSR